MCAGFSVVYVGDCTQGIIARITPPLNVPTLSTQPINTSTQHLFSIHLLNLTLTPFFFLYNMDHLPISLLLCFPRPVEKQAGCDVKTTPSQVLPNGRALSALRGAPPTPLTLSTHTHYTSNPGINVSTTKPDIVFVNSGSVWFLCMDGCRRKGAWSDIHGPWI